MRLQFILSDCNLFDVRAIYEDKSCSLLYCNPPPFLGFNGQLLDVIIFEEKSPFQRNNGCAAHTQDLQRYKRNNHRFGFQAYIGDLQGTVSGSERENVKHM